MPGPGLAVSAGQWVPAGNDWPRMRGRLRGQGQASEEDPGGRERRSRCPAGRGGQWDCRVRSRTDLTRRFPATSLSPALGTGMSHRPCARV